MTHNSGILSGILPRPAKPRRASPGSRIIADVFDHLEPETVDQGLVLRRCQARVIQGVVPIATDRLPMLRSCVEHQPRSGGCVVGEYSEHSALVIVAEVKETVPSQDAAEAPMQRQLPHVGHDPLVIGQTVATKRYHRARRVNARHAQASLGHMLGNRPSRTTAQVQNPCSCRQVVDEEVVPDFIIPSTVLAVGIPGRGVPLVVSDDEVCRMRHSADVGGAADIRNLSKPRRRGLSRRAARARADHRLDLGDHEVGRGVLHHVTDTRQHDQSCIRHHRGERS